LSGFFVYAPLLHKHLCKRQSRTINHHLLLDGGAMTALQRLRIVFFVTFFGLQAGLFASAPVEHIKLQIQGFIGLLPKHFATSAEQAAQMRLLTSALENLDNVSGLVASGDSHASGLASELDKVLGETITTTQLAKVSDTAQLLIDLAAAFTAYKAKVNAGAGGVKAADVFCLQLYSDVQSALAHLPPTLAEQATTGAGGAVLIASLSEQLANQLDCLKTIVTVDFSSQPEAVVVLDSLVSIKERLASLQAAALAHDSYAIDLLVGIATALGTIATDTQLNSAAALTAFVAQIRAAAASYQASISATANTIKLADLDCSFIYGELVSIAAKLPVLLDAVAANATKLADALRLQMTALGAIIENNFVFQPEVLVIKSSLADIATNIKALEVLAAAKDPYASSLLFTLVQTVGTEIVTTQLAAPALITKMGAALQVAGAAHKAALTASGSIVHVADVYCSQIYADLNSIFSTLPLLVGGSTATADGMKAQIDAQLHTCSELVAALYANQAEVAQVQRSIADVGGPIAALHDLAAAKDFYASSLLQDIAVVLGDVVTTSQLKTDDAVISISTSLSKSAAAYQATITKPDALLRVADVYCSQLYSALQEVFGQLQTMTRIVPVASKKAQGMSKKTKIIIGAAVGGGALLLAAAAGAAFWWKGRQAAKKAQATAPMSPTSVAVSIAVSAVVESETDLTEITSLNSDDGSSRESPIFSRDNSFVRRGSLPLIVGEEKDVEENEEVEEPRVSVLASRYTKSGISFCGEPKPESQMNSEVLEDSTVSDLGAFSFQLPQSSMFSMVLNSAAANASREKCAGAPESACDDQYEGKRSRLNSNDSSTPASEGADEHFTSCEPLRLSKQNWIVLFKKNQQDASIGQAKNETGPYSREKTAWQ